MGKRLDDAAVAQYRRDGYYFPVRVCGEEEAAGYRRALEAFERRVGGPLAGKYRSKPHLLLTFLADLVRHPAVLDAVEDVIGPDILCWNSNFFTKEARSEDYVSWHQDATYWGLSGPEVVTAWIAFTPSDAGNGAMEVIPGSHTEQLAHRDTFADRNLLTRGQEIEARVDPSRAVRLDLRAGEMSLHHVLIVHGSRPNPSADRRIGLAVRYVPTRLRQIAGPADSASLLRGEDAFGNFELEPRPERDMDPAMVALHDELTARAARILYRGTDVMAAEDARRRI